MGVKEDLPASGDDVSPSKERCKKEAVATKPRQKQGRTPRESKIMAPSPRRGNHHDGRLRELMSIVMAGCAKNIEAERVLLVINAVYFSMIC